MWKNKRKETLTSGAYQNRTLLELYNTLPFLSPGKEFKIESVDKYQAIKQGIRIIFDKCSCS